MKHLFFGLLLFVNFIGFSQNNPKEALFTIDGKPYYTDEFSRVYNKNLDLVKDESQKDLNQYLELFIGYKLKINKAYKLGLQKGEQYQKLLFYIEIFPVLLFAKQMDFLEMIFERYQTELFDISGWRTYTSHNIYLIANVLLKIKTHDYKDALYSLNQINLNVSTSNSYYHYLKLFYSIAAYQLEKHTTNRPDALIALQKEYLSLVKKTGFKRFTLTLLKNY